jgi:Xaa-Pro aminopeptidase
MKPLDKILNRLKEEGLDGIILSNLSNISYLVGFNASDAYLLLSTKGSVYFTDSRYTQEVGLKLKKPFSLKQINGSFFSCIAASALEIGLKKIGFEERYMPYAEYKKVKEVLKGQAYLIPTVNIVETLRQFKSSEEILKIKKALEITALSLDFTRSFIKPGIKELEVAAELERFIRYKGAQASAFDIIVASGPNSAYPHHRPTQRKLADGEPVLIDLGVDYSGYKSDLTRVFFLGKINNLGRKIYDIVLCAQGKAIKKIKAGEEIAKIDALSRNYIALKGYSKFFIHSLGHGIGLETHEAPSVSSHNDGLLKEGMVFTVEPGVYLPGKFGIRIEDMVLVTKKGCEVLSGSVNK